MTTELSKVYEPREVEERWLAEWLKHPAAYAPDPAAPGPPFSIVIPPPNVTGSLHMGHALNNTLQDILARYHRMKGDKVLWVPGTDHAGIATQMVVERQLATEGQTRHELGREAFVKRVWEWKERSGGTIVRQLKRLGASCDWSRERFTLDEGLSAAVRKVFVELHRAGLIYRDKRLVNWDPKLHTAISDLEVEQREVKGHLWHIKYPLEGRPAEFITVATTRPETLLGDTAVAVHPGDERYKKLVGKKALLPLAGRAIPIVADEYADPEHGSGAVKITPAHDFNDFEVGRRHNLPLINILDANAHLNDQVPEPYRGLSREAARKHVLADLEAAGLFEKTEEITHRVPYGDRSGVIVEPWLTDQWFVKAEALAKPAIEAVASGAIQFIPKHWENTFFEWLRHIQPWCISRQLWWGHQIPAWYGPDGAIFVELTEAAAQAAARKKYGKDVVLTRDPDVLDTWFSSALWPFSTLGWPDPTPELKTFYPTSVLVTAHDIIFFWVARMIMLGLHFMKQVPFRQVYIHALVRDAEGKKMSKSKGNVIDPLTLMDEYGTDAFRFTLAALAAQGRDIRLSTEIIEGYRNFANKIWNAARFALMNLGDYRGLRVDDAKLSTQSIYDSWILLKLRQTVEEVESGIQAYEFDRAAKAIYQFFWHDFCDWYLEFSKIELNHEVLYDVLHSSMALLHPFMPFLTEEIYQRLKPAEVPVETIQKAKFPRPDDVISPLGMRATQASGVVVDLLVNVITAIRSIRGENRIAPAVELAPVVFAADAAARAELVRMREVIHRLGRCAALEVVDRPPPRQGMAHAVVGDGLELFIPLAGLVDFAAERDRLKKEITRLEQEVARVEKKLANPAFVAGAPPEVVEAERAKLAAAQAGRAKLLESLSNI